MKLDASLSMKVGALYSMKPAPLSGVRALSTMCYYRAWRLPIFHRCSAFVPPPVALPRRAGTNAERWG